MKRLKTFLLSMMVVVFFSHSQDYTIAAPPLASPPSTAYEAELVEQAIRHEIEKEEASVLLMLLYDTRIEKIQISEDGLWASAWLVPVDPITGYVVHTEPGLAFAQKIAGVWKATLPSNPEWVAMLDSFPGELVTEDALNNLIIETSVMMQQESATYTGFKLPWAAGETMALTQSTGHDRYTPSGNAHYAFDFAKPGYPSGMFNVHAAKAGEVKKAVWTYVNGSDAEPGNYLLVEDNSTTPTTFHLYLHLAQNSIPVELRTMGASIQQGQFIGIADNTGVSSGNHLHFMVHEYAYSYWGRSVDITFSEVSINGGRPRISSDKSYCRSTDPCSQFQTLYTSANTISSDTTPPTGGIIQPTHNTNITSSSVRIKGWANDDNSGLASVQVKAKFNGEWQIISPSFSTSTFTFDWDVCANNIPDGPITLALEIRDQAGNPTPDLPGLTQINKISSCAQPVPVCIPDENQIALFADPDYEGACTVFGTGSYSNSSALGDVGGANAASILVGENVAASLFNQNSFLGRGETFVHNDSNLADNLIGIDTVTSVIVQTRNTPPSVPRQVYPDNGSQFSDDASFSLSWENAGGGVQFQARLLLNSNEYMNSGWQSQTNWRLNSLPVGNYTWQVRSANNAGQSAWSSARNLVIQSSSLPSVPVMELPFFDDIETQAINWDRSKFWDLNTMINHTPGGMVSWFYDINDKIENGYDSGEPNSGYVTLPPISLPTDQTAFLHFWYYYETESPGLHWDQRWVQISANGGPFTDLHQFSDDVTKTWLKTQAISLADYAGMTVRIRFYFVTLDKQLNRYKGWYIDDVSVNTDPPSDCADTNNSFSTATPISYDSNTPGQICPAGDVDYYSFQGTAGDQIGIRVTASSIGSSLDSYLSLYDSDGTSLLAENDDMVLYQETDSFVTYRLKRTGIYYIRVRSWDHPSSGGNNYPYNLSLNMISQNFMASFVYPQDGQVLPKGKFQAMINVNAPQSSISHVDFWWHSPDWQSSDWVFLSRDVNGSDGWTAEVDPAKIDVRAGISIYAKVFDKAGNSTGVGIYNLLPYGHYLPIISK